MTIDNEQWLIEDGVLKEYRGKEEVVRIPNGVKIIGNGVFRDKGIRNVILPCTIEKIGDNAFRGNLLSEVNIPKSCYGIGSYAFYENNGLLKVSIRQENVDRELLIDIDLYAFPDNLQNLYVSSNVFKYAFDSLKKYKNTNINIFIDEDCNVEELFTLLIKYCKSIYYSTSITLHNIKLDELYSDLVNELLKATERHFSTSYVGKNGIIEKCTIYRSADYGIILDEYEGNKKHVKIPNFIGGITENAFEYSNATELELSALSTLLMSKFCLQGSDVRTIKCHLDLPVANLCFFETCILDEIFIVGDNQNNCNLKNVDIDVPDRSKPFYINMPVGIILHTTDDYSYCYTTKRRSNLIINIFCNNSTTYDELESTLNSIPFTGSQVRVYNAGLNLLKYKLKHRNRCKEIFLERKLADKDGTFNVVYGINSSNDKDSYINQNISEKRDNTPKYSNEIDERLNKIRDLIKPLNDTEENDISKLLDNILKKYKSDKASFKPKYDSSSGISLCVGPTSIKELDLELITKLDFIINKLQSSDINLNILKDIDNWLKRINSNKLIEVSIKDDMSIEEMVDAIIYIDSQDKNKGFKSELIKILKSVSICISKSLKFNFDDTVNLTLENTDYKKGLETKIDDLFNKARKYKYIIDSINGNSDTLLSKSLQNIKSIISLLDEKRKEKLKSLYEEALEKLKNTDLSLSINEIIEYADNLLKPIREELAKDAYFSIRLKRLINGINISLELLKTGEAVYQDTDIITDTVNEILSITPEDITESVKSDLLRVITNWDNKLKNRDFNVSPNFNNMNGYNKSLLDTIEKYKLMFGEHNSSDIKVFKIMEEKAREGFVEVSISKDEIKHIELLALYLTILKDLYTIKYKVECYVKEKEQYERQFVRLP